VKAQTEMPPEFNSCHKNIYVEFLGSSILTGISYDMRLNKGVMDGIGVRAGIGGLNVDGTDDQGNFYDIGLVTIPIEFNHLVGKGKHSFQSCVGILPAYATVGGAGDFSDNQWVEVDGFGLVGGFMFLGYRRQPLENGFMFQAQLNPMIVRGQGLQMGWIGIGVGFGFK